MTISSFIFGMTLLLEIKNFQEYLQIPSVHPNPDYDPCVQFLRQQAKSLQLPIIFTYPGSPDRPVVVISWIGTEPNLPSILLNSHMDVVPVIENEWTYPPFAANIDNLGNIYARGTQDTKGIGIQYLEAIRRLKNRNIKLKRSVHVLFVPDEEIGGMLGMEAFIKTQEFMDRNIGFALDEGKAEPSEIFRIFYGERTNWQFTLHCKGPTGHASLFFKDTAGEKLNRVTAKFFEFRQQEIDRLENNSNLTIGDVTTINLTVLSGGEQINVVPGTLSVTFDVRIAIDVSLDQFEAKVQRWCEEAGGNIDIEFLDKPSHIESTNLNENNFYWVAFRDALKSDLNLKIQTEIAPFATDSRFLREIGIPAFGFTPMNNTPDLQHANDEHVNIVTFLKGIEIYEKILLRVGNVN